MCFDGFCYRAGRGIQKSIRKTRLQIKIESTSVKLVKPCGPQDAKGQEESICDPVC